MSKRFDYCCKNCWHTWKSEKKYISCPKCKSYNLDTTYEIIL